MKKQICIVLLLFICSAWIDVTPIRLEETKTKNIQVVIKGAIEQEKTISLPIYATINDALESIDLLEEADTTMFNPQTILKNGDIIDIPYKQEKQRISINTADVEQLCSLHGIGEKMAQRIIEYRQTNGLFQTIEQIKEVKGIGDSKFEKIQDDITL